VNKYQVRINGKEFEVLLKQRNLSLLSFEIDGHGYEVDVQPLLRAQPSHSHTQTGLVPAPAARPAQRKASGPGTIAAPMPGIIVNILVDEGDKVEAGQTVVIIEAMKMENNIAATTSGTVKKVHVKKGQEVNNAQELITIG
jgi:biotin carboxyl carrier protein